jgi:hypothetical protein
MVSQSLAPSAWSSFLLCGLNSPFQSWDWLCMQWLLRGGQWEGWVGSDDTTSYDLIKSSPFKILGGKSFFNKDTKSWHITKRYYIASLVFQSCIHHSFPQGDPSRAGAEHWGQHLRWLHQFCHLQDSKVQLDGGRPLQAGTSLHMCQHCLMINRSNNTGIYDGTLSLECVLH